MAPANLRVKKHAIEAHHRVQAPRSCSFSAPTASVPPSTLRVTPLRRHTSPSVPQPHLSPPAQAPSFHQSSTRPISQQTSPPESSNVSGLPLKIQGREGWSGGRGLGGEALGLGSCGHAVRGHGSKVGASMALAGILMMVGCAGAMDMIDAAKVSGMTTI